MDIFAFLISRTVLPMKFFFYFWIIFIQFCIYRKQTKTITDSLYYSNKGNIIFYNYDMVTWLRIY